MSKHHPPAAPTPAPTPPATSAPAETGAQPATTVPTEAPPSKEDDTRPIKLPTLVPTLEEVVAAGYNTRAAAAIVAEEQAKADGKSRPEQIAAAKAASARVEADEAIAALTPKVTKPQPKTAADAEAAKLAEKEDPVALARAARNKAKELADASAEPTPPEAPTYTRPDDHHDHDFKDKQGRDCRAWVVMTPGPNEKAVVLLQLLQWIPGEPYSAGDKFALPPAEAKDLVDRRAAALIHPGALQVLSGDASPQP